MRLSLCIVLFTTIKCLESQCIYASNQLSDYTLFSTTLYANDLESNVRDIITIFTETNFAVVTTLTWKKNSEPQNSSNILKWSISIDGIEFENGEYYLNTTRNLPNEVKTGENLIISSRGVHTITVRTTLDDFSTQTSRQYRCYPARLSLLPVFLSIFIALKVKNTAVAMIFMVFIGSFMTTTSIRLGISQFLMGYFAKSFAVSARIKSILSLCVFATMLDLMKKSGGFDGFISMISRFTVTSKSGQLLIFLVGLTIFYDDFISIVVLAGLFRPIADRLSISREKLSFLVDSTGSIVSGLLPITTWIATSTSLIQTQLNLIIQNNQGVVPERINRSALDFFLQCTKYRYYELFSLFLIPLMIVSGRDYGSMLIAERKVFVYGRTDGGDGTSDTEVPVQDFAPDKPKLWHNLVIPAGIMIVLSFSLMISFGWDGSDNQTLGELIGSTDAFGALLMSTLIAIFSMMILYSIQITQRGRLLYPSRRLLKDMLIAYRDPSAFEEDNIPQPIISFSDFVDSSFIGFYSITPLIIPLILAWTMSEVVSDVGSNRYIASWILSSTNVKFFPTLAFLLSSLIAIATGTSFGTMRMMIPVLMQPAWDMSNGDVHIVQATIASILSGAVFGDHISPISDTTILSSFQSGCTHLNHVYSQASYAAAPFIFAIVCGTIPNAYSFIPNYACLILGCTAMALVSFGIGVSVINDKGAFDFFTEATQAHKQNKRLEALRKDTSVVASYRNIES